MTSINFNVAANTALRTLQATNTALEASQNRVSTGLKIGEAKDNAAYWSISTTLKSDNKALSTVSDALGLGAATVDTAYQGLNKAMDVLDEIKTKLVSASQDGVDKTAIQGEIKELQAQLTSIASSSSFSGENWLSVNSTPASYTAVKNIVSSFNRTSSGAVTLGTISIDAASFALIDGSATTEGILDANKIGNTNVAGLGTATAGTAAATGGSVSTSLTLGTTPSNLSGTVTLNGTAYTFSATPAANTGAAYATVIGAAANGGVALSTLANVVYNAGTNSISITSIATGTTQNVSLTLSTTSDAVMAAGVPVAGTNASPKTTSAVFGSASITLDKNDSIAISATVDGSVKTFSVTKAAVDAALGTTNGVIADAAQYAAVINTAMLQANVTGLVASSTGTGATSQLVMTAANATTLSVAPAVASKGTSILTMDVSTIDGAGLLNYINVVSDALNKVTSAAATLGAVSSRIDLQKTFVTGLMDTIDKGVSSLVDADLSEESTKLQALQTKQQLGIQALSIANTSTQNVLSLFRS